MVTKEKERTSHLPRMINPRSSNNNSSNRMNSVMKMRVHSVSEKTNKNLTNSKMVNKIKAKIVVESNLLDNLLQVVQLL